MPTKRPRQTFIAGAEPPSHPDLDDAADDYHRLKEERMALTKEEAEAKERVKALMVEYGLTRYVTPSDLECVRQHEDVDTVTVKAKKAPKEDNGDGDDA